MRSLRKSVNKKYLYFDALQFLMKTLDKDESTAVIQDAQESQPSTSDQDDTYVENIKTTKRRKRYSTEANFTDDPLATPTISMFHPTNEDEAFFASILPFVSGFNEDEKLEFRLELLQLVQRIRQKRKSLLVEASLSSLAVANHHSTVECNHYFNPTSTSEVKEESQTEVI